MPFDEFRAIFETSIQQIGCVISLLDRWERSAYPGRLWCLLEAATAEALQAEYHVILPPTEHP